MEFSPDEPRTWLVSLLSMLAAALGALAAWTAGRHVKQHDGLLERVAALEKAERIAAIEKALATKAELSDIGQVYERLTDIDERISGRLTTMSDRMAEQHVELLEAVYDRGKSQ